MISRAKDTAAPVAAIEIRHRTLALARFEPAAEDGSRQVRTRSIRWRRESNLPASVLFHQAERGLVS